MTSAQSDINGMPLYFLLAWLLARWGESEVLLRLPSVLAGTLAVVAVYLLGKRLFGERAAVAAGVLTALVPFSVWYSQEARAYALFMLLTTLQMLFALTAIKRGRWFDWLGLAAFSSLNLYTHYLALAATAAVTVYVGVFVAAGLLSRVSRRGKAAVALVAALVAVAAALVRWRPVLKAGSSFAVQHDALALLAAAVAIALVLGGGWFLLHRLAPDPPAVRQLCFALGTGLLVVLAYAPWLPSLRVFLGHPDQSVLRYDLNHAASLGEVLGVLAGLGLSGALLAGSALGLAAVVAWLFRGRAAESALLLCWLGVSVALLWLALRGAIVRIEVRYFAFLFPAAMLLVGAAVEAASVGIASILARRHLPVSVSASVVAVVLVAGMLVPVLPALAASYGVAKSDYRALAGHIAATSPPGSVVLAIGDHPDYVVICMSYYLRRLHAPVTVVDARLLNSDLVANLAGTSGIAWGVAVLPSAGQKALLERQQETVTDFADVSASLYAVRAARAGLSPPDQVRAVLGWEMPQEPELGATLKLIDLVTGRTQAGPNLLPPGGPWQLQGGTSRYSTAAVEPGTDYALTFEYRNGSLNGSQVVGARLVDRDGQSVITYLDTGAYACPASSEWRRAVFSISVPRQAAAVIVNLSVRGSGTADFRDLSLGAMRP